MKSGNRLKGGFRSFRLSFSVLLNHQVCIFECNIISTMWGITLVTLKLAVYGTPWKSELIQTEMDQRAISGDYVYRQKFNVQLFDFNGGVLSTEWLYPITRQILSDYFNSGYMTRDMRYEWARFLSFLDFPSSMSRSCIRLAQAGFYYNSNDGKVHCFSCGITHDGILTSGNPIEFHNHISPKCPFMLGRDMGNVPIHSNGDVSHDTGTPQARQREGPVNENIPGLTNEQPSRDMTVSEHTASDQRTTIHNSPTLPVQSNSDMTVTEHTTSDQRTTIHNSPTPPVQSNSDMIVTEHTTSDQRTTIHNSPTPPVQSNSDMIVTEHTTSDQRPAIHNHPTGLDECPDTRSSTGFLVHLTIRNRNGTHLSHPAHPQFTTETSRLATFTNFPRTLPQSRESLARAGFFYSGVGDSVRCFFCGGGLCKWEAGDDPWMEHARWFPRCKFLHKHKGRAFRLSVQQTEGENSTLMSQPAAQAMLMMGYSEREIIQAYEALMAEFSSVDEISAIDLMDYMFRQEDIENNVTQNDISSLVRENEDLKKQLICKVCLDEPITIVFLPCAHFVCCHLCSQRLTTCPVCRGNITRRLYVYMA